MITHLGLIIFIIISYEIIIFFNLKDLLKKNLRIYSEIIKNFSENKLSDDIKQNLIIDSSKKLFFVSIKILIVLVFIVILFFFLKFIKIEIYNYIMTIYGLFEIIFVYFFYAFLRKKINEKI